MKPTMDLAVVTSCHNYGQYLDDWARSIVELETWPTVVALVDNGSTDATPVLMERAAAKLREAGLTDVRTRRIPRADFGTARNAAVELGAGTEWVMHMDADDMFMAHCLDDVAVLAPEADVVALGYQRCGNLAAGPSNRTRVYSNSQGQSTLKSTAPASGVSPFRRRLWEVSPYRTDMAGGWDTALWIGFAHLDARFVATRRPCFYYRQHADSVFNVRRLNRRAGRMVGSKLQDLRRRRGGVSVLVPRRSDGGGPRDHSWSWVRDRYAALYPGWEVVEGHCSDGPWRKGVALSVALEDSRGQTLVIADSDCVLPEQALIEAVALVQGGDASWVVPHTLVKRLDQEASERIMSQDELHPPYEGALHRAPYEGFAGGGFIVVDASAWSAVGGIPAAFAGWGAEDEATALMLDTILGPHTRLPYDLWHLWHPPANARSHAVQNRRLLRLIAAHVGDRDGMFHLAERMQAGASVDDVIAAGGGGVVMVALMDFQRGTEVIRRGDVFMATEDEVQRHEGRPRKIAMRAAALGAAGVAALSPHRTAEIHSEQHQRNQAANAANKGGVRWQEHGT